MTRFKKYQNMIYEKHLRKQLKQMQRYEENGYSFYGDRENSVKDKIVGAKDRDKAKVQNLANSLPMQMSHNNRFTQLSVTITFGYNRVKDCRSYAEIEKCIMGQAASAKKFLQKIRDSKHFRSKVKSKCPTDKPYHYLCAVELQEDGDLHLHFVVYVRNSIEEIVKMIRLIHDIRRRLVPCPTWSNIDCRNNHTPPCKRNMENINDPYYEVGRTHIGLSSYWHTKISDRYMLRQAADKKTGAMQYVIEDLNYGLFVNGQYTFLEFYDMERLKATNTAFVDYIVKMQAIGNGNIKNAIYRSQTTHHLKSMVESAKRYEKDRAVLSHLGIRVLQYSQAFFPVNLYQKIRPALIRYDKKYKHLYHATLDLCAGELCIAKKQGKSIVTGKNGEKIATA